LCKLKKFEEALTHLNKAIALNPQYAKALVKRGEVNQRLENYEEALKDFQAANNLNPCNI
jgi:tetratricopeptide (TPR) repeat protein